MIEEIVSEFDFDEHILKLDLDEIRRREEELRRKNRGLSKILNSLRSTPNLDSINNFNEDEYNEEFCLVRNFFQNMYMEKYCNSRYIIEKDTDKEIHKVRIYGTGVEDFELNGESDFNMNFTRIPVEKNGQEFRLAVYAQPQTFLPPFGKINVEYRFETNFRLGYKNEGECTTFTDDVFETSSRGYGRIHYYYGEPGKVYFRIRDALYNNMNNAIFGDYNNQRPNFHLQGRVYLDNKMIYQGEMESSGTFPFFIERDNDNNEKDNSPKHRTELITSS